MNLYDSHIHLCSKEYIGNIEEILHDFFIKGGKKVLSVSYDLDSAYDTVSLKNSNDPSITTVVDIGLGIHPEIYALNSTLENCITDMEKMENTVKMLDNLISANRNLVSAIGETGLDYKWIKEDNEISLEMLTQLKEIQKLSFKKHIEMSLYYDLPMSIHSRDTIDSNEAVEDTIKIVSQEGLGKINGVFHSYTGSLQFIDTIINLGFKIGINGIVTYKSGENIRTMVKSLPEDALILETDGPYLQPEKRRRDKNRKNRFSVPSDIIEIAEMVADVRNDTLEHVLSINERNYTELFN